MKITTDCYLIDAESISVLWLPVAFTRADALKNVEFILQPAVDSGAYGSSLAYFRFPIDAVRTKAMPLNMPMMAGCKLETSYKYYRYLNTTYGLVLYQDKK